jgi:hypothetical protein
LPQHHILHEPGEKLEFTYFLNEGMTSIVALSGDGRSVEVGIVGKEGMVGMSLTVGLRREMFRPSCRWQAAECGFGHGYFKPSCRVLRFCDPNSAASPLMQGMQVAQLAACNRLHETEQRLVRWLLMCQDRVDSKLLPTDSRLSGANAGYWTTQREPGGGRSGGCRTDRKPARNGEDTKPQESWKPRPANATE